MSRSLLTLFAPPEGCIGDFGMLCGFTASRDVLGRIARTFSGDASRPRLAAFIHPTAMAVTDVPGVAWMHFRRPTPFRLLHAKVALLGFRGPDEYCLRLAVSTGNWTAEPLTTSIDMFWCDELGEGKDKPEGKNNPQLVSDIRAAADLFDWLRAQCDDALLRQAFDGTRPDEGFKQAIDRLSVSPLQPRFVDTRKKNMRRQVMDRLTGGQRKHLAIGSGFHEGSEDPESECLIKSIRDELVRSRRLAKENVDLDLVLNPDSCQGLHVHAEDLVQDGWNLRKPGSCHAQHSQANLHAKYLFLAEHKGKGEIGSAQIYIGSANFSRAGFLSVTPNGNLEAGIVITPDPKLSWRDNAKNGIRNVLPGNFEETVQPTALASGAAFEPPPDPPPPPPVTFVEWANSRVSPPEGCEETVIILGLDNEPAKLPCAWPEPAPAFVTLHPNGWKVPVRADGALVVPRSGDLSLEDILAGVDQFPAFPIGSGGDEEDGESLDCEVWDEALGAEDNVARDYPIRRMMQLISRLAEFQKTLDPRDWQRWCRELQQNLPHLTKTEATMIATFRDARMNPLRALTEVEFLPAGVDPLRLQAALSHIEEAWGLSNAQDLWEHTS